MYPRIDLARGLIGRFKTITELSESIERYKKES
jgi:hypothetical protein